MRNVILAVVAVVAIGVTAYVGCDGARARVDVASDKVIDKIDDILGKLNVQQKKVQNAYDDLVKASEGLHESRLEAEIRMKNYDQKLETAKAARQEMRKDLARIQPMLEEAKSSKSIERDGRTYTLEELKGWADSKIKEINNNKEELARITTLSEALKKNYNLLKKNDDTSTLQLAKLKDKIDQINQKKKTLDVMREAATITGPNESISDKFDSLTADVDELLIQVDTDYAIEVDKIDKRIEEMSGQTSSTSLDEFLKKSDDEDVDGTLGNIADLLKDMDEDN